MNDEIYKNYTEVPKCRKCGKKEIALKGSYDEGYFVECKCGEKTKRSWIDLDAMIMWAEMNQDYDKDYNFRFFTKLTNEGDELIPAAQIHSRKMYRHIEKLRKKKNER